MNTYFLYGPINTITTFAGQAFSITGKTKASLKTPKFVKCPTCGKNKSIPLAETSIGYLEFGYPIAEEAGVVDQRGYYHHRFTQEQFEFANQVIADQGLTGTVLVRTSLPKKWRYATGF